MARIPYVKLISEQAERTPDHPVALCGSDRLTSRDLDRRSNRLARTIAGMGVQRDDTVSICLPNGFDCLISTVAVWKLGATPNPLSATMPEPELRAVLSEAKPALVIGLSEGLAGYPSLPSGIEIDTQVPDGPLPMLVARHERALASGGSTGRPKLIVPMRSAEYDPDRAPRVFTPEHASVVPGPLYHALQYSILWGAVFAGKTAIIMKRFDALELLQLVEKHRVDLLFLVPAMMMAISKLPQDVRSAIDVSSLRLVVTGGAKCPAWLFRAWIDWLGADRLMEGYGPSEGIVRTYISGAEWLQRPGSVGRPADGGRVRILDPLGNEVPCGTEGEIFAMPAMGPGSTFMYRGAERRVTPDGWESVGDLGYVDEDGYLYINDRRVDMIVCNGRNVFPAEIEAALSSHEDVRGAVVVGLPDDERGQRIHAIIESDRVDFDEELRDFLSSRLQRYKAPHSYEYVRFALINEAGKVRRSALRDERMGAMELTRSGRRL